MRIRSGPVAILSLLLALQAHAQSKLFGTGAMLDPRFCKEQNLRQTVVYVDDSILVAGNVSWAETIYDKLAASLVPGERTTLVELSPTTGDSSEVWAGCWPAYTIAERKKLASQTHFFSGDPLADLDKQQKLFRYNFGVGAEKIEKKGGRAVSAVAVDPDHPPEKSILRALAADGARYAQAQETVRAIIYSDLAENSDLGSVFKPQPEPAVNYGAKLGTTLRRSVFYAFGIGGDVRGDSSVKDAITKFWKGALHSMAANVAGIGSDLSVPNMLPTSNHPYDVAMTFDGQKTVGRLSILTDDDGALVDSWIGIVRLGSESIFGTFHCSGLSDPATCTLSATTSGGLVSDAPSETLSMSGPGSSALSGTIGVPSSSVNIPLTATPASD